MKLFDLGVHLNALWRMCPFQECSSASITKWLENVILGALFNLYFKKDGELIHSNTILSELIFASILILQCSSDAVKCFPLHGLNCNESSVS